MMQPPWRMHLMKVAPNVKTQARCCKTTRPCTIITKMCRVASCGVHCSSSPLLDVPINGYMIYDLCIRRYETFRFWQDSQRYASIWRLTMPSQRKLGHWNLPSKQDSHEPDCYLDCVACYEGWTKNKVEASHGISWYLMMCHDISQPGFDFIQLSHGHIKR